LVYFLNKVAVPARIVHPQVIQPYQVEEMLTRGKEHKSVPYVMRTEVYVKSAGESFFRKFCDIESKSHKIKSRHE
jgi:hypothetical protein